MSKIQSLYTVSGNTFEERRANIVESKYAAAEAVATGKMSAREAADALGLSEAFVQHYANNFKAQGGSAFKKSLEKEEETMEKGLRAFLKQLLDQFKQAIEGR